jgi:hypothetical protein
MRTPPGVIRTTAKQSVGQQADSTVSGGRRRRAIERLRLRFPSFRVRTRGLTGGGHDPADA